MKYSDDFINGYGEALHEAYEILGGIGAPDKIKWELYKKMNHRHMEIMGLHPNYEIKPIKCCNPSNDIKEAVESVKC